MVAKEVDGSKLLEFFILSYRNNPFWKALMYHVSSTSSGVSFFILAAPKFQSSRFCRRTDYALYQKSGGKSVLELPTQRNLKIGHLLEQGAGSFVEFFVFLYQRLQ